MVRKEQVSGHWRRDKKGEWVKVGSFRRKAKPKARTGIHRAFKKEVIYYQDDQGRLVSRRKYRRL